MTKHFAPGAGPVARRTLLQGMAGAAALTLLPRHAAAQAAKEAPELAKLVADGKLPKLADRLPAAPMVVKPLEKIGTYGGTLRRGLRGSADHNGILRMVGNQGLVRWNLAFTDVLAVRRRALGGERERDRVHLLSAQGHEMVGRQAVHRRRHPVLDRDCAKNTELFKSPPSAIVIGGKACNVEKVDETTVKFSFAARSRCSWSRWRRRSASIRRCSPSTTADNSIRSTTRTVADLVKQAGLSNWARSVPRRSAATSRFRHAGAMPTSRRSSRG